jgi:hypothetical protein
MVQNISVGDFVLVAKVSSKSGGKLRARWLGPGRETAVESDWLFEVEDLISGERAISHSERLKFYHDQSLNVTEDLIEHVTHNQSGFEIDTLNELRKCPVSLVYEVNVSWRSFSTTEATWEPLTALHEDCPVLFAQFLVKLVDQDLATPLHAIPCLDSTILLFVIFSLHLSATPARLRLRREGEVFHVPMFPFLFILSTISHTFRIACCITFP